MDIKLKRAVLLNTTATSKYAKLAKCSLNTALRDLQELMGFGLIIKGEGGGRSTHYKLDDLGLEEK